LPTVEAFAYTAGDANGGHGPFVAEVDAVRVDELAGVADIAAQPDRVLRWLLPGPGFDGVDGLRNGEESGAVGHFCDLRTDLSWHAKRIVDDPARAGSAKTRKMKSAAAEAL